LPRFGTSDQSCWLAEACKSFFFFFFCQLIWYVFFLQEAFGGAIISSEPELSHQGAAKFFTSGGPAQQRVFRPQPFGAFKAAADALAKAAKEVGMSAQLHAALHLDQGADGPADDPASDFVMTTTTQVCKLSTEGVEGLLQS